jgi:hypothetical protein
MDGIRILCDEVLGITFDSFTPKGSTTNCSEWYKSLEEAQESIFIKKYGQDDTGYTVLNLHGSFFEYSPDFRLTRLFYFLSDYRHTIKQLDIAYNDYGTCLYDEELEHWFKFYKEYIAGNLVSKSPPDRVLTGVDIKAFRFGLPTSKNMYATIYKRPDTELWRVEIKIKSKKKILYMLEVYDDDKRKRFDKRCANLLNTCISFVKPHSKTSGKAKRYKMQPAWEAFMNTATNKLIWAKVLQDKRNNREVADKIMTEKKLSNVATRVKNTLLRLKSEFPEEEEAMKKSLEEKLGYKLIIISKSGSK